MLRFLFVVNNKNMKENSVLNQEILELENKIFENCNDLSTLRNLAQKYFESDFYIRSMAIYFKLLAAEPKNAFIWNKLAVIFLKLGEY